MNSVLILGLVSGKFRGSFAKVCGERGSAGPFGPLAGASAAWVLDSSWAAAGRWPLPRARPVGCRSPLWVVSCKPRPRAAHVGRTQVGPSRAGFGFSFLEGIRNRLLILFLSGSLVNIIKLHRRPKIVKLILLES